MGTIKDLLAYQKGFVLAMDILFYRKNFHQTNVIASPIRLDDLPEVFV